MAVMWSRVFGRPQSTCCPPSCYNFQASCSSGQSGNVLDGFPLSVQTVGQAVADVGASLETAIGAQSVLVRSLNSVSYELDIRLGPKARQAAVVRLTFSVSGNYPITCTYTQGTSTGQAKFNDLGSVIGYISQSLRR